MFASSWSFSQRSKHHTETAPGRFINLNFFPCQDQTVAHLCFLFLLIRMHGGCTSRHRTYTTFTFPINTLMLHITLHRRIESKDGVWCQSYRRERVAFDEHLAAELTCQFGLRRRHNVTCDVNLWTLGVMLFQLRSRPIDCIKPFGMWSVVTLSNNSKHVSGGTTLLLSDNMGMCVQQLPDVGTVMEP